jgi:hypothetical protein
MRLSLRCAPVAELGRVEINQQVTAGLFVRVLSDADVTWAFTQRRQTKARLYSSLRDPERSEYNS